MLVARDVDAVHAVCAVHHALALEHIFFPRAALRHIVARKADAVAVPLPVFPFAIVERAVCPKASADAVGFPLCVELSRIDSLGYNGAAARQSVGLPCAAVNVAYAVGECACAFFYRDAFALYDLPLIGCAVCLHEACALLIYI